MITQRRLTVPFVNYLFLHPKCFPERSCAIGDIIITNDSRVCDLLEATQLPLCPGGITVLIKAGCAQVGLFTQHLSERLPRYPIVEKLWKPAKGSNPWSLRIFWDRETRQERPQIDWWR